MRIDITTAELLSTGLLPKTGSAYQIAKLSRTHLGAITALHETVYAELPEDKKSFLMSRDTGAFERHLTQGNIILGCLHAGRLIAQGLMTLPDDQHKSELMIDMQQPPAPESAAVLGSMIVHPDYRGNHLQDAMLAARTALAYTMDRADIISSADIGNMPSWKNLLKKGLKINTIGYRKDGTSRYIFHGRTEVLLNKNRRTPYNGTGRTRAIECPYSAIDTQKVLLCQGYQGTAFNAATGMIEFRL